MNDNNTNKSQNKDKDKETEQPPEYSLQRFFSSEELDQMLHVVNPRLWVAYMILLFLIVAVLLWAFLGSIPIKVEGRGVFVSPQGLFSIEAKVSGIVQNLRIQPGKFIRQGDPLADVFDPHEQLRLELAIAKTEMLERDLNRLKNEIESERIQEKQGIMAEINSHRYNIEQYERQINDLKNEVAKKKQWFSQGLIPQTTLRDAEKELDQKQINLEIQRAELAVLNANLHKSYRTEEYKAKEQQLLDARQEKDLLQMTKDYARIYSPFEGYVIEILHNEGERVVAGEPLILLEHSRSDNKNLIVYGFVSIDVGKRIKAGMPVQMRVSTIRREEFGKMLGKVQEVSEFAVSPERLMTLIPNKNLIEYLMGGNAAVIQLTIHPELDSRTPSGYRWSSGQGPPTQITAGTVCTVDAIIERVRPFYYVLPLETFRAIRFSENSH